MVRALSDWIMAMRGGRLVEAGPTEQVYQAPAAAYTRQLDRRRLWGCRSRTAAECCGLSLAGFARFVMDDLILRCPANARGPEGCPAG